MQSTFLIFKEKKDREGGGGGVWHLWSAAESISSQCHSSSEKKERTKTTEKLFLETCWMTESWEIKRSEKKNLHTESSKYREHADIYSYSKPGINKNNPVMFTLFLTLFLEFRAVIARVLSFFRFTSSQGLSIGTPAARGGGERSTASSRTSRLPTRNVFVYTSFFLLFWLYFYYF